MYRGLKEHFWWNNMKREIATFVAHCLTCQQVKADYQRLACHLQSLPIPQWKWKHITMDFITRLIHTLRKHELVWVIVDRLTKSTHFLPSKPRMGLEEIAELYLGEIVQLHSIPMSITYDQDSRFISRFWRSLQSALGTKLTFSTAFHPQTDGQSERTIQILEDMLRACALDFFYAWDHYFPHNVCL